MVSLVLNEVGVISSDSGWVEVFNETSSFISLNSYVIITRNNAFNLYGVISPGEYKVFYLRFSINSDSVAIKDGNVVIDSYSWISLPSRGNMGRYPDVYGEFKHFLVPTPGRKNEVPSSLDEHSWGRIKALFGPNR